MRALRVTHYVLAFFLLFVATAAWAQPQEKDPLRPRVPFEKRERYKALESPLYSNSRTAPPDIVEAGQKVYERVCANCHGESGNGVGRTSEFLPVKPRDFTNCLFQKKRTDGELFYIIKFGSWPMPPMIQLISENEAWEVVAYIRKFCF